MAAALPQRILASEGAPMPAGERRVETKPPPPIAEDRPKEGGRSPVEGTVPEERTGVTVRLRRITAPPLLKEEMAGIVRPAFRETEAPGEMASLQAKRPRPLEVMAGILQTVAEEPVGMRDPSLPEPGTPRRPEVREAMVRVLGIAQGTVAMRPRRASQDLLLAQREAPRELRATVR